MIAGGVVELVIGINAEGKSLEDDHETAHLDRHDRPPPRPLPARPEEDANGRLRRDHHRHRRGRRHARPAPRAIGQADPAARARRLAAARARELVDTHDVFVDNRYVSADTWHDGNGRPFQPQIHYFVGGATKLYGAALYRLRKEDFGELHHHDGISPAWPISYDELEPYYTLAEQHYEVHGARGEDPTEPPASAPVPVPGGLARAADPALCTTSSRRPATTRSTRRAASASTRRTGPTATCVRCATCDGYPVPRACEVGRGGARRAAGARARERHAAHEREGRQARDRPTPGTAVTEVVVERDGEEERYSAPIVVVACGAANTAKLLLASANDKHPNGLANGSDQVGRNYMFHDEPGRARALARREPDRRSRRRSA